MHSNPVRDTLEFVFLSCHLTAGPTRIMTERSEEF